MYFDNTNELRLGLLLQILDRRKYYSCCLLKATSYLQNYEFEGVLETSRRGKAREFCIQCPEFVDRLVVSTLSCQLVSTNLLQGLYTFCPELLLEGDNDCVISLFNKLVRVLERSGDWSGPESKSAVEEFLTHVVDTRARHVSSGGSAEGITSVVEFLLSDYSFLFRKKMCRVLKLCCLVAVRSRIGFLRAEIDLSDCVVPELVVTSCVQGIQNDSAATNCWQKDFFT